jgi:hypothetical protein
MNVAVIPRRRATFFTMYLYFITLSAIWTSGRKRMSISHWPAVATSWCCASISIPASIIVSIIAARTSWSWSFGGTGK